MGILGFRQQGDNRHSMRGTLVIGVGTLPTKTKGKRHRTGSSSELSGMLSMSVSSQVGGGRH